MPAKKKGGARRGAGKRKGGSRKRGDGFFGDLWDGIKSGVKWTAGNVINPFLQRTKIASQLAKNIPYLGPEISSQLSQHGYGRRKGGMRAVARF
jgi:hypothetical protein